MTLAAKKKQALTSAGKTRRPPVARSHKTRIPEFKTIAEEAEWWDTHDLTDYWDEFKPVQIKFARNLKHSIVITLAPTDLKALEAKAKERGISFPALAQEWIEERLRSA